MNLYSLCKKIEKCDYPPLPSDIYSKEVSTIYSLSSCSFLSLYEMQFFELKMFNIIFLVKSLSTNKFVQSFCV